MLSIAFKYVDYVFLIMKNQSGLNVLPKEFMNDKKIIKACCTLQGWAILEDFIAIPILGGKNCRELVNF